MGSSSRSNRNRIRDIKKPVVAAAAAAVMAPVGSDGILFLFGSISTMLEIKQSRFLDKKYGLTLPQFQLMMAANSADHSTLGSLAVALNCSRGNLTGVADRLERDGWITRIRSEADRRVVHIALTEKGTKISEVDKELNAAMAGVIQLIPPNELAGASSVLATLYKGLKKDTDTAATS